MANLKKKRHPTPEMLVAARKRFELTQSEAGELAFVSLRRWASWEGAEAKMHWAIWMWFLHAAEQEKAN